MPAIRNVADRARQRSAQLDVDDREILMLREYDELSYQEIAKLKQLPLNTVRSRLFRARMALKTMSGWPARCPPGESEGDPMTAAEHQFGPEDVMAYVDGELLRAQAAQVRAHLAECPAARRSRLSPRGLARSGAMGHRRCAGDVEAPRPGSRFLPVVSSTG